jgi:hypothetical protein
VTPSLYFPCANCGMWRRQHLGKERKCPFASSNFVATEAASLTARDRRRLLDRLTLLHVQKVEFPRRELDEIDVAIDGITTAAQAGCAHKDDDGSSLLETRLPHMGNPGRTHMLCPLCDEDWYE